MLKNNLKKILNNKHIFLIIIVVSFIISLLITIISQNIPFVSNETFTVNKENISLINDNKDLIITVNNINKYIKKLAINIKLKESKNVYFLVFTEKNTVEQLSSYETWYGNQTHESILKINKEAEKIKIVMTDINKSDIEDLDIKINNNFEFNLSLFIIIFLIIYFILDLTKIAFTREKITLHTYFLKLSLVFGILFAIYTPMYYSLDEKEHLIRAYNVSSFNLIQKKNSSINWPIGIKNYLNKPYEVFIPTTYQSEILNIKELNSIGKNGYEKTNYNTTAITYLFPAYLASGTGIFLARIFNLSYFFQFYLGRIFNVILYSVIVMLAIKYSGKYKNLFFIIGLLPYFLFQSGSYSSDTLTNAFALLSVSLTLYYRMRKEKMNWQDITLLLITYILTFITKATYFPISLLIFLIPKTQFKDKKLNKVAKFIIPIASLITFIICTLYASKMGLNQWEVKDVDSLAQLKYIFLNPIKYLMIIYKTFDNEIIGMLTSSTSQLGYCGNLGNLNLLLILFSLVFNVIANKESDLRVIDKIIIFFIICLSVGASITAIYLSFNPVYSPLIAGFQGRYLAPLLIPFLLIFTTPKLQFNIKQHTIMLYNILIIIYLNVYSLILILNKYYL